MKQDGDTLSDGSSRGIVYRVSTAIDNAMRSSFFHVAYFVSGHPVVTIVLSVMFALCTLGGIRRFRWESRTEKLWLPRTALRDHHFVQQRFGSPYRHTSIVFLGRSRHTNLATRDAMLECVRIAEAGARVVAPSNHTFARSCVKLPDLRGNRLCFTQSPFDAFYDPNDVVRHASGDVDFYASVRKRLRSLGDAQIRGVLQNGPETSPTGLPLAMRELVGGVEGQGDSYFVRAMRFSQITSSAAGRVNGAQPDRENDQLERAWGSTLSTLNSSLVRWQFHSQVSSRRAQRSAVSADLPLFFIAFPLVTVYVMLFLGEFHLTRSRFLLALVGLINAGLALCVTFGLSSATGLLYGPLHQALPLLVVGIGIDDVFVVTHALDEINRRFEHKPVRSRIALALSNAGSAITVTSATNTIVFALGAISRLPALRSFAFWAAIGVLWDWAFTLTFFTAALTLDTYRQEERRPECCLCFPVPVDRVSPTNIFGLSSGSFSRFFTHHFAPLITHKFLRPLLLLLFTAQFAVCLYGCTKLHIKSNPSRFYPSGSQERRFTSAIQTYFQPGIPVHVYLRDVDLSTPDNQRLYSRLCHPTHGIIASNAYIQPHSVNCWYTAFHAHLKLPPDAIIQPSTFYTKLAAFLHTPAGTIYFPDFYFPVSTRSSASRLFLDNIRSIPEYKHAYDRLCRRIASLNTTTQQGTVDCWYDALRSLLNTAKRSRIDHQSNSLQLRKLVNSAEGMRQLHALSLNNGTFQSVRFRAQRIFISNTSTEIKALQSIRRATSSAGFGKDSHGNQRAFPYHIRDLFIDQNRALPKEILLSLSLAAISVAVICFQLVGHPLVAVVCVLVVAVIIVDILGILYFSGVNINSVSAITIVISAGFSVDYVVHIARSFLEQVGNRKLRAINALGALGPPVFYSGFSTFLAVLLLAFAKSYFFYQIFVCLIALSVYGLTHGLILAPILLSIMGPPSFFATEEEKELVERALFKRIDFHDSPPTSKDSTLAL